MGDTGPCGPCSEIHVDLTPDGDTQGRLVNKGMRRVHRDLEPRLHPVQRQSRRHLFTRCPPSTSIPAWASSASPGSFRTRRVSPISRARSPTTRRDIFRPIFDALEKLSGKRYGSTLPKSGSTADTEQEKIDVAFRVIADHIRTLSFAIADGILPGNNDRNYVLRRILRRAVRYGRTLGFHEPFFYKLVDVLAETWGIVFPEIAPKAKACRRR